jgi:hypothetical protein
MQKLLYSNCSCPEVDIPIDIYSTAIGKVFANVRKMEKEIFVTARIRGEEVAIAKLYSVTAIRLRYILALPHNV